MFANFFPLYVWISVWAEHHIHIRIFIGSSCKIKETKKFSAAKFVVGNLRTLAAHICMYDTQLWRFYFSSDGNVAPVLVAFILLHWPAAFFTAKKHSTSISITHINSNFMLKHCDFVRMNRWFRYVKQELVCFEICKAYHRIGERYLSAWPCSQVKLEILTLKLTDKKSFTLLFRT